MYVCRYESMYVCLWLITVNRQIGMQQAGVQVAQFYMLRGQLFLQELRACMHLCIVVSVTMRLFICASIRGSICSSLGRPTNLHIDRSMYVCMYTCVCVRILCVCVLVYAYAYVCVRIYSEEGSKKA